MSKQSELPGLPPKPKSPRVKRAHMIDAGEGQPDLPYGAAFQCSRCGWNSGWWCFDNQAEIRRGLPCPTCNPETNEDPACPAI